MLVLTRKRGESIVIGDSVKVTVNTIGKDRVKLGIQAPVEIAIHRQEVAQRIDQEHEDQRPAFGRRAAV